MGIYVLIYLCQQLLKKLTCDLVIATLGLPEVYIRMHKWAKVPAMRPISVLTNRLTKKVKVYGTMSTSAKI